MNNQTISDTILYEDSSILLCHKRAGTAVQTKKMGEPDMVSLLKNHLYKAAGQPPYLGVLHRLDQPVEGLLLFAKTPLAAKLLSSHMNRGSIQKKYLAVTAGIPKKASGRLTDYLFKDSAANSSRIVTPEHPAAKKAVLTYQVLKTIQNRCLLEIELETGRHHQIRVQLAQTGAPLLGDRKYGRPEPGAFLGNIALCAYDLTFPHPETKETMHFQIKPLNPLFSPFYE